jgi:hypothetical protein
MSELGEVARYSPQTITNMFIDNGDGTYTVRFFHGSSEAFVTVNTELPNDHAGDGAYFAGWGFVGTVPNAYYDGNNVLWVALAEKAYVQLSESGWDGHGTTNAYANIGTGGDPATVYSVITGHSANDITFSGPSASITTTMVNLMNSGHALTLTTKTNQTGLDAGFVANHLYMVVGYNAANQTFEVVNPWNDTGSQGVGVVQWLDWDQIGHNFAYMTSGVI